MKLTITLLIFLPAIAFAQTAAPAAPVASTFWDDPFNYPLMSVYVLSFTVFVVALMAMGMVIKVIRYLNMNLEKEIMEKARREGKVYVAEPSMWETFWERMNASVPVAKEKSIELDHNYDGIRELDNHLPPWWKWMFYACVAWSVVYMVIYHVSFSLPSTIQEYNIEVADAEASRKAFLASQPVAVIDENALVYNADAELIAKGQKVFTSNNCQSCHRADGGGTVGPNLTDDFWIHGGSTKEIFSIIKIGVPDKGMPAWGKVMSPQDVRDVTFFVMSLRGTNPPNPKAPQGVKTP
jgi:cytochrome c oxidase cbb3-type subunit III